MACNQNCRDCVQRNWEQKRWATKQAAKRVQWALAASETAPVEETDEEDYACYACGLEYDTTTPSDRQKEADNKKKPREDNVSAPPTDTPRNWLPNHP